MASFSVYKRGDGWRTEVRDNGRYDSSSTFDTKAQASAWGAKRKTEIEERSDGGIVKNKTCRDAFKRYELEVSCKKRGHRWEAFRLANFAEFDIDSRKLGDFFLSDVTEAVISRWRDLRLARPSERTKKVVTGSTVKREMNLLANVFSTARKEWKWMPHNPTKDVKRPKESEPRDRRISEQEIKLLCFSLGFDGSTVETKMQRVAVAFLFAIETAMRAGEICSLEDSYITGSVAHLPMTKNGSKRDVPLSPRAIELLSLLPKKEGKIFDLDSDSLSTFFGRAVARCMIKDLHFHDSRHEATTRLAKIFNVLELARITGHKDLRQLMVYFNLSAEEMALNFMKSIPSSA